MKKYKLGEICTIVPGYAFKAADFGKGLNYVIKIKDIMPPYIDILHSEKVETVIDKKYEIKYGDFVMAMTGATIGKIGKLQIDSESKAYINQRVCKFIPEAFCDKEYLYYKLNTQEFQRFIYNNVDSKLAQPNIGHPTIYKYELELPLLSEQRRIGQFLKAIDDKINLNRAINHNLEAIAKQLYDYWFVQFDFPDENGNPYKSSGGKMVWNDFLKRNMPEGWLVGYVKEFIAPIERGISYSSEDIASPNGFPMLNLACYSKAGDYRVGEMKYYSGRIKEEYKVSPLTLLIACTDMTQGADVIGRPILATEEYERYVFSMDLAKLTPNNIGKMYLYYTLRTPFYHRYIKPFASGTTVKHLNVKGVEDYKIAVPPIYLQKSFENTIKNIKHQQMLLIKETLLLTKQRDELLPLLMNGQVSVNYDLPND